MQFINLDTGIDGGKRVNGRKRTLLVDTLGIPWSVKVTAANISDNQGGVLAVNSLKGKVPSLQKITADGGYKTTFVDYVTREFKWEVEIARNRTAGAARIDPGICSSKKPLAGGKVLRMVKSPGDPV